MTVLRLSYDDMKVTIDLRRAFGLQNIVQKIHGYLKLRFTHPIVRSWVLGFANQLTIFVREILPRFKSYRKMSILRLA